MSKRTHSTLASECKQFHFDVQHERGAPLLAFENLPSFQYSTSAGVARTPYGTYNISKNGDASFHSLRDQIWDASNGAMELVMAVIDEPKYNKTPKPNVRINAPPVDFNSRSTIFKNVWRLFPRIAVVRLQYFDFDTVCGAEQAAGAQRYNGSKYYVVSTHLSIRGFVTGSVGVAEDDEVTLCVSVIPLLMLHHDCPLCDNPLTPGVVCMISDMISLHEELLVKGNAAFPGTMPALAFTGTATGFPDPLCERSTLAAAADGSSSSPVRLVRLGGSFFRYSEDDFDNKYLSYANIQPLVFLVKSRSDEEVFLANPLTLFADLGPVHRSTATVWGSDVCAVQHLAMAQDWMPVLHQFGGDTTRVHVGLAGFDTWTNESYLRLALLEYLGVFDMDKFLRLQTPGALRRLRERQRQVIVPRDAEYMSDFVAGYPESATLRYVRTGYIEQIDIMALYGRLDPLEVMRCVFHLLLPEQIAWRTLTQDDLDKVDTSVVATYDAAMSQSFYARLNFAAEAKRGRSDPVNLLSGFGEAVPSTYHYYTHRFACTDDARVRSLVRDACPLIDDTLAIVYQYMGCTPTYTQVVALSMAQFVKEALGNAIVWTNTPGRDAYLASSQYRHVRRDIAVKALASSRLMGGAKRFNACTIHHTPNAPVGVKGQRERFECFTIYKDVRASLELKRLAAFTCPWRDVATTFVNVDNGQVAGAESSEDDDSDVEVVEDDYEDDERDIEVVED